MTELKVDNTRRIKSNKLEPKFSRTNRSIGFGNGTQSNIYFAVSSIIEPIELNPDRFCSESISWYWVNHAGEIIIDLYWMVLIEKRRNIKLNVNVWLRRSAKRADAAEHHAWVWNLVEYPSDKIWLWRGVRPCTLFGEGNHVSARRGGRSML